MKLFSIVIAIVFLIWLSTILGVMHFLGSWSVRGQFGDSFGAATSLFTGLAFAGVIYTIYLQQKDLTLQREELRLQREEMAASRRELANQAEQQRNLLLASVAELKLRVKEAEISAIEMASLAFNGPGRAQNSTPQIRQVANAMQEIVTVLSEDIGAPD